MTAYDGTEFHGWQRQPGLRTVQGVLEDALAEALRQPIEVSGAGRTDAGVHARGQCASFTTTARLPARALGPVLDRLLPADVRIRLAEERPRGFHARHSARGRRYAFRFLDHEDVLLGRFAWRPRRAPDPARLERALRVLEGVHDCRAFESSGSPAGSSVCRIARSRLRRWEGGLLLDIVADHFLYHMVRTVVGTALQAAETDDPEGYMVTVREARDRTRAGVTVPACGLCLEEVFYEEGGAC